MVFRPLKSRQSSTKTLLFSLRNNLPLAQPKILRSLILYRVSHYNKCSLTTAEHARGSTLCRVSHPTIVPSQHLLPPHSTTPYSSRPKWDVYQCRHSVAPPHHVFIRIADALLPGHCWERSGQRCLMGCIWFNAISVALFCISILNLSSYATQWKSQCAAE